MALVAASCRCSCWLVGCEAFSFWESEEEVLIVFFSGVEGLVNDAAVGGFAVVDSAPSLVTPLARKSPLPARSGLADNGCRVERGVDR